MSYKSSWISVENKDKNVFCEAAARFRWLRFRENKLSVFSMSSVGRGLVVIPVLSEGPQNQHVTGAHDSISLAISVSFSSSRKACRKI